MLDAGLIALALLCLALAAKRRWDAPPAELLAPALAPPSSAPADTAPRAGDEAAPAR